MKLPRYYVLLFCAAGLLGALYVTWACAGKGLSQGNYKKLLGQALDEVSRRTPEEARRRIEFGLNLFIAHEAWIEGMPRDVLIKNALGFINSSMGASTMPRVVSLSGQLTLRISDSRNRSSRDTRACFAWIPAPRAAPSTSTTPRSGGWAS